MNHDTKVKIKIRIKIRNFILRDNMLDRLAEALNVLVEALTSRSR